MNGGTGEFELIERLRERLGRSGLPVGPGDDAAVLPASSGAVVTVDTSVEGLHFPLDWDDPTGIARRAIAVSLSDLAAMGALPGQILIALGVPTGRDRDFWLSLAEGVVEAASEFGVELAGGDVVRSPVLFLSVTAVGSLPDGQAAVTRAGATPGDRVAVTGRIGGARAGLLIHQQMLFDPSTGPQGAGDARARLLDRYLRPTPLLEAGVAFGREGAGAMIDVSDGLLADLGHVARESGVRIVLDPDSIPVDPAPGEVDDLIDPDELLATALVGGDDYELALTFPPERLEPLQAAASAAGTELTVIGTVAEGEGVELPDGFPESASAILARHGFEHSF